MISMLGSVFKFLFPSNYCAFCGRRYEHGEDKQLCPYCNKYYCSKHFTPKKHSKDCAFEFKETIRQYKNSNKNEISEKIVNKTNKHKIKLTDPNRCDFCNQKYKDWTDAHRCRYCGGCFCSTHWVPEIHKCKGNLLRPPGGMVETHHASGKISVRGK